MKSVRFALLPFAVCVAVMGFGCSAAKDVVNRNIPAVNDPLQINGRSLRAAIGRTVSKPSRAIIAGAGNATFAFDDKNINRADDLNKATVRQSLQKRVTVFNTSGAPLPDRFTLSGFILNATVSDGGGSRSLNVRGFEAVGPFVFERTANLDGGVVEYNTTGTISLSEKDLNKDDTQRLVDIITEANGGSNQNAVLIEFGFDADDTQLPEGTEINFTFEGGEARVGI
jgi:hypothetical protein